MEWFATNWFWVVLIILFIGMHFVGHGGRDRHGQHRDNA